MIVLVGCECSGVVREAFRARGHIAFSNDLLPADDNSPHHLQCDLFAAYAWLVRTYGRVDLVIAHPPCTYLCNAGARWWPGKQQEQIEALWFIARIFALDVPKLVIENPPGRISTVFRPADQYVQPWEHGHMEKKRTGLWLRGLSALVPTDVVYDEMVKLPVKDQNRIHYMGPSADRGKLRSVTYSGIAAAMAAQWG